MRCKNLYLCEYCYFESTDRQSVLRHEAEHLGLSDREYEQYRNYQKDAQRASKQLSLENTPKTRQRLDEAIQTLLLFEKTHKIDPAMRPSLSLYRLDASAKTK